MKSKFIWVLLGNNLTGMQKWSKGCEGPSGSRVHAIAGEGAQGGSQELQR